MRIVALLVVAACTSPAPVAVDAARPSIPIIDPWDPPTPPLRLPVPETALASLPTVPPVIAGPQRTEVSIDATSVPHIAAMSGPIEVLAVTEDAHAAVTADALGSVRVWPTLDGKREPVVLAMQPPAQLAIERDADGFAIAGIDPTGQLEIVQTTAAGAAMRRIEIAIERPLVTIRAVGTGFVAVRDDRVVSLIDLAGSVRAELVTDPGDYLASIAVRHGRALAVIETDGHVRGRWIDLEATSWGAWTPTLPILADHVALSPDHQRIAALRPGRDALVFVRLADGKVVDRLENLDGAHPVGFVDRRTVVMLGENGTWRSTDDQRDPVRGEVVAIADGVLVRGDDAALAMSSGYQTQYVGYRMSIPAQLLPTRSGYTVTDGRSVAELDASFRTRAGYAIEALSPSDVGLTRIELVAAHHALGFSYQTHGIYLVNTELATTTLIAPVIEHAYQISTRLLYYYSSTDGARVARFDADTGAFGPGVVVPATETGQVILLDPDTADGNEVAIIQPITTGPNYQVTYGTVVRDTFVPTKERVINPTHEWLEDGALRELVRSTRLRARSPDHTLVAELRDQRLALRAGKTVRWTVPSAGANALVWTPRGELIVYGAGIARVDLETGALRERRCGLWFGRWDEEPNAFGTSQLCEAP